MSMGKTSIPVVGGVFDVPGGRTVVVNRINVLNPNAIQYSLQYYDTAASGRLSGPVAIITWQSYLGYFTFADDLPVNTDEVDIDTLHDYLEAACKFKKAVFG